MKSGCNRGMCWDWEAAFCRKAALDWRSWEKNGLHFIAFSLILCLMQMSLSLCLITFSDFPKKWWHFTWNKFQWRQLEYTHTHNLTWAAAFYLSNLKCQLAGTETLHTRQNGEFIQVVRLQLSQFPLLLLEEHARLTHVLDFLHSLQTQNPPRKDCEDGNRAVNGLSCQTTIIHL